MAGELRSIPSGYWEGLSCRRIGEVSEEEDYKMVIRKV